MSKKNLSVIKSDDKDKLKEQLQWLSESNQNMMIAINALLVRSNGELRFSVLELELAQANLRPYESTIDHETKEVVFKWAKQKLKSATSLGVNRRETGSNCVFLPNSFAASLGKLPENSNEFCQSSDNLSE